MSLEEAKIAGYRSSMTKLENICSQNIAIGIQNRPTVKVGQYKLQAGGTNPPIHQVMAEL